ncbi:hypothetical protein [Methanotorris igneus]|uniref:Uncharacterized protein n=1 Tax=Methanotorris igneus (strain DSM 5666 / JCM 11834 / Kol 5) TaxID=880724 RepID=F6BAM9_METIK|nr:hypothetical protein [Methanotorris igneus]AEF95843.1 hypothetical protein Metig_0287 [Methanotorris igneus Kol 5]
MEVKNPYVLKKGKCKICGKDIEIIENTEEVQKRLQSKNISLNIDFEICEECRRKEYLKRVVL